MPRSARSLPQSCRLAKPRHDLAAALSKNTPAKREARERAEDRCLLSGRTWERDAETHLLPFSTLLMASCHGPNDASQPCQLA